ncbi:MAG: hypothetical protein QOF01_3568 [Thermomicrobiales bacterium]|jgi:uncharacterized membrane protein YkvA (DUF1232 family)|nr:hypothetical protein [Thermomicrobiales bacterium]
MTRLDTWKTRVRRLKTELVALSLAYRDPRTPWYAKVVAACVVGYAFSPLDLIPDPIPILGYLDDLVLLPLGIALAIRLIPPAVLADARAQANDPDRPRAPANRLAAAAIVLVWLALAALAVWLTRRYV